MKIFGIPIPFTRQKALSPVDDRAGWRTIIGESYPGAFQQDVKINNDRVVSNHAVFACQTLIASDISKLRVKLVQKDGNGIWSEVTNPAYSPVLRKPNHFQTRIQFFETWVLSKLQHGNVYALKQRDNRGVVRSLYVLDPTLVNVLVSDSGDIFYELHGDKLAGLGVERMVVPAREIIHDRFNTFFHPLIGLSPIFAAGLSAVQGLAIQQDSTLFFQNGAQPGGILTAPGAISDETATRLKTAWETNYGGQNRGKVAVLGDGLKYEAMKTKAVDAQLIEQLKWSAEVICGVYHVPPYKIGIGQMPSYNNVQSLNVEYYQQALQKLLEDIEACLDDGLGMDGVTIGVEFDTDGLMRMDTAALMESFKAAVSAGVMSPNEARAKIDLKPATGGESPYLQQQNFSLAALAKRDAQDDPFGDDKAETPAPTEDNPEKQVSAFRAKMKCEGSYQRSA